MVEELNSVFHRIFLKLLEYLIGVRILVLLHHRVVPAHGTLQLIGRCLAVHIAQHYRDVLHDAETDQLGRPDNHGLSGASASEQLRRHRDCHAASYFESERSSLRVEVH